MSSRAGVVDLRDFSMRYAWKELHIARFLAATALTPDGPARVQPQPPSVVIAIVAADDLAPLVRAQSWLEDASHVIVLREHDRAGGAAGSIERLDTEWRAATASFAVPIEKVDLRPGNDLRPIFALAASLAESAPPERPQAALAPIEHPAGPPFEIDEITPRWRDLGRALVSHVTSTPDDVVLHTASGQISLLDPPAGSLELTFGEDEMGALPDGRTLIREDREIWRVDARTFPPFGDTSFGFDPQHPVGWTGHRMMMFWLYRGSHGVGFLSACDHDFPCGPAKKLWGYEDNDPVAVSLAPDLSAVAYHFEHDVLLTSAMPVGWRSAGALDVADFQRDPRRALFFVHDPRSENPDLLGEDARFRAPALVLGPSAEARYALDLNEPTYRIDPTVPGEGAVTQVGGPGQGIAVFDAAHRLVRRCEGRLLGGWFRHATLVHEGRYHREDLATGERHSLGLIEADFEHAVAVAGTTNVILVGKRGEKLCVQLI